MMKSFETEVQHLWDILDVVYNDSKTFWKVNDFEDLARKSKHRVRKLIKEKTGEPLYEDIAKVWDEISFVKAAETEVEKSNRTYLWEKDRVRTRIIRMRDRMKRIYDFLYPIERRVMEERLTWLEKEYYRFDYMINPYHIQPGILLDVDITSIKRKKVTLDAMANVLNEFLHGVSKGFQDAAFASFSRRRSTVREDINQSFGVVEEETVVSEVTVKSRTAIPPPKSASKKKGVVDTKAKSKNKPKPKRGGRSAISEL